MSLQKNRLLPLLRHVRPIGEGHFSIVYEYRHRDTDQPYAVKRLRKDFLQDKEYQARFRREIEVLELLQGHPNIIPLLDADPEGASYLMPLASCNLFDYIKRHNSTLAIAERLRLFSDILGALSYAHGKDVVHRDLCPHNVLLFEVGPSPRVAVSDFGLAKVALSNATHSSTAQYGHYFYAAPEQLDKLKDGSVRSDVFSLGNLLYFILTGKDPVRHDPTQFSPLIARATSENPAERHSTLKDFSDEFVPLRELLTTTVTLDGPITLRAFLASNSEPYDWARFLAVASAGLVDDHVYRDFIDPAVEILARPTALEQFAAAVGDAALSGFADVFIEKIRECISTVGWPFDSTIEFSRVVARLFSVAKATSTKMKCFELLWDLAYVSDRWAVQDLIRDLFARRPFPSELEGPMAAYVLASDATVAMERFARVRLPRQIEQALIRLANKKRSETSES